MVGDAREDVGELGLRIDTIQLRRLNEGVGDGGRLARSATLTSRQAVSGYPKTEIACEARSSRGRKIIER